MFANIDIRFKSLPTDKVYITQTSELKCINPEIGPQKQKSKRRINRMASYFDKH